MYSPPVVTVRVCVYCAVTGLSNTVSVPSVTVMESLVQVTVVAGPPVEIQVRVISSESNITSPDIVMVPIVKQPLDIMSARVVRSCYAPATLLQCSSGGCPLVSAPDLPLSRLDVTTLIMLSQNYCYSPGSKPEIAQKIITSRNYHHKIIASRCFVRHCPENYCPQKSCGHN